ncbi:MAG: hypothetical protein ABI183_02495, partial [Polyangiaceae bacterium]
MSVPKLEELVAIAQLKEFADSASRVFGLTVSITNESGALLAGGAPQSLRDARPRLGPPEEIRATTGDRYVVGAIELSSKALGRLLLGPLDVPTPRARGVADHLLVSLGLILHAGE